MLGAALVLALCATVPMWAGGGSEAPATKASGPLVTLKFTGWGGGDENVLTEQTVATFNKAHEGSIKIEYQNIPDQYDTKIMTMVAANAAPDVAMMESASITFPLAAEGKLLNLADFVTKDPTVNLKTLVPNITYWADPKTLIGIAPGPEIMVLFYNVDMFKEAGLEMPPSNPAMAWTWDKFVDIAKKLTVDNKGRRADEAGFDPNDIKQFGVNVNTWWAGYGSFLVQVGADIVTKDGQFGMATPEAIDVIQKLADLMNVYHVAPTPVQAKALPGSVQSLQTKRIAMDLGGGQWQNLQFGNSSFNYDIGVLPRMGPKTVQMVVCGMFSIFSQTKYPKESLEWLKTLIDPVSFFPLHEQGLWMPSIKTWYTEPELLAKWTKNKYHPAGFMGSEIDAILNYSCPPFTAYIKNFSKIMDVVNPAMDNVWLGQTTAKDALTGILPTVKPLIQGRRD